MIELVVGLGNPGHNYQNTRHNIGFMALDKLPFSLQWQSKFKGEFASVVSKHGHKVYFLKPMTYMNLSGESVVQLINFFKISNPENVLVIHDELDLPFGTVMLKKGGGLAGHNGLKSIAGQMGTQEFCRLRLGISRPTVGSVSDYVLSDFSKEEKLQFPEYLNLATDCIVDCIQNGYQSSSNKYSKKSIFK